MKDGDSRDYTFNLRRGFLKSPKWKRSKKAIAVLHELVRRHAKVENVKIGRWLNEHIWKHGGKNPPGKVKVNIKVEKHKDEKTKAETLIAHTELAQLPPKALRLIKLEEEKKKKAEAKKKIPEKLEEKPKEEKKKPTKKAEKKSSKKELQKELAEAKEVEEKKKKAKVTASIERKMHK